MAIGEEPLEAPIMSAQPPDRDQVQRAIDIYVSLAYENDPPHLVRAQLESLQALPADQFLQSPLFTRDFRVPPTRYSLRLGNRVYPHMKLTIEASPDDSKFLFRPDTHDGHVCPPASSPEYPRFRSMMEHNQKLAERIDAGWAAVGIPTFKSYLRDDLARRQGAGADSTTQPAAPIRDYKSGLD